MESNRESIALIGIACTFAGGIETPQSLWKVLKQSIDVGSEIPKERFDIDSYVPIYNFNKPFIRRGYFLNNNQLDHFDPSFFGISDREAMTMDPCHRLVLEKFVHLIEDANYTIDRIQGSRTAVYIGQFTTDHMITFYRSKIENHNFMGPNISLYNASARLAYHFDLHGPNLTLDTACSSSLQAVHLAVQSLRNGEADLAVAGGTNLNYAPENFFTASTIGAISPDGRSRAYSEDANGYAKGEGVGLVLLKRLSDAIRDNDHIYCVIRDVMVCHDGHQGKTGYNVPSNYGQTMLLNEVYKRNKIDPSDIFYIEGHGTGTQVGDPIEANALGAFFNRSPYDCPLLIGSIKSVIGHTEGTAGVASLIKIALCMKHRMITPNMNFTRINPSIHAKKYNLHIVNDIVYFPDQLITVGINSFGIGGNTAHAIVTEWSDNHLHEYFLNNTTENFLQLIQSSTNNKEIDEKKSSSDLVSLPNPHDTLQQHFVLTFSAKCPQSLKGQIEKFSHWLSKVPEQCLNDTEQLFFVHLCEKILLKRTTSFSHRLSFVFSNNQQLKNQIQSYLTNETNHAGVILPPQPPSIRNQSNYNICFIYSGQGPQWWAMGRELYSLEPVFHQWIQKLHLEFLNVSNNSFSLIKELIETNTEEDSHINHTNIAQPAILAIQIALSALWISWGIYPKIIVGHSVGEIAAAFVAGRLTLHEAVKVIYHRSRVQNYNTNKGGRMLALFLSENDTKQLLMGVEDQVQIGAINSPQSVTLSGDEKTLKNLYENLSNERSMVFKRWLRIENAFHSKQMERFNIREELLESLADISGDNHNHEFDQRCSNAILYSTVTGTRSDQSLLNGEYWWANVRNGVLFDKVMQSILDDMTCSNGIPIFIEISPHPVLSAAIPECFQYFNQSKNLPSYQSPIILPSLKRKDNKQKENEHEQLTMLSSLCQLFSLFGSNIVDWKQFYSSRSYSSLIKKTDQSKLILSSIEDLPHYTFNHQICWYEPKDSVFTRRAIRKEHHPLLGYRQWHNEAKCPTWNKIFLINKHSKNFSYLFDHTIQGNVLFPAAGYIELIIAALNQLLFHISSQQLSIKLQQIKFLTGLYLKEDETIQIETVIVMPFREFFIYSRRKQSNDSIRLSGISGNDIITTFSDENVLHNYASKEWTLHCHGLINLDVDVTLMNSIYDFNSILSHFLSSENNKDLLIANTEYDIQNLYRYFSQSGFKYGNQFQSIKTLYRANSEVLTEHIIPSKLLENSSINDQEEYYFHPAILDGCFQGMISLVPRTFYESGIPISIEELIICNRKTNLLSLIEKDHRKIYTHHSLNPSIKGITTEEIYTGDILLFSVDPSSQLKSDSLMIFQGFKLQKMNDNVITKTIFERIDESSSIFNINPKNIVPVNELIDRFCAYQYWQLTESIVNSSLSSEQKWFIFYDQKQGITKQIANILLENSISHQNITFIHLSTEQTNICNSFNHIFIDDSSLISTKLQDILPNDCSLLNILFAWPLDLPTLNQNEIDYTILQAQEIVCGTLMHILQSIYKRRLEKYPRIFVLTHNSQCFNEINSKLFNLTQSSIIGFARSLLNEYPNNHMKLIDLQYSEFSSELLHALIKEFSTNNNSFDEEVLLNKNNQTKTIERFLPRYKMIEPINDNNSINTEQTIIPKRDADQIQFHLQVPSSRLISDLQWFSSLKSTKEIILESKQVEIQIECVGISFRDILKVRGLHPYIRGIRTSYDSDRSVGLDFSGIVLRKGSEVNLNIHDRVFGMITNDGAFKSHMILNENDITQGPSNYSMEQLSTLPTYLTALYCLRDCIQLKSEQTILIHAAASAVGIAMIEYCQMIGAKIFVTAGTEEKRKYLRETYHLEHVFNSRDLSFVRYIRETAPNGMVDVIVNSLSGHFLIESLKLLAPLGHFIELGKRDVYANSKLPLLSLRSNCNFHVIDTVTLQKYYPERIRKLLEDISNFCQNKKLKPIIPMKVFEPSDIQHAFSTYSQATHIGKFVVKITQSDQPLQLNHHHHTSDRFHTRLPDEMFSDLVCLHGTILISGGLGGLAIEMSKWMIEERGVKRIALLSRRNITELDQTSSQFQDWINLQKIADKYHASVQVFKVDVTNFHQVIEVVHRINSNSKYPIRGIIHSAMILHDCLIQNMTQDILSKVMQPKIHGAWNLHCASEICSTPLHFFIMFSSIRNHIADLGQSNYNAGNNFLDSLAYWRRNYQKLPALSISLPAISDAGYLHKHGQSIIQLMQNQGIHLMPALYVFQMIEKLHRIQQQMNLSAPVMFVLDWKMLSLMNLPTRLSHIAKEYINTKEEKENIGILHDNNDESMFDIENIIKKIRLGVSKLFGSSNIERVDVNKPLIHQGMDSLIAVELRSWLVKEISVNIPLVDLLQGMSINDLALFIQEKLLHRQNNTNIISHSNQTDTTDHSSLNDENKNINQSEICSTNTPLINPLLSSTSKYPLFCIHDIIGLFQTFIKFTVQIKEVYQAESPSIFAFRASGYESGEEFLYCIHNIAEEYIFQMKRKQPIGPYHLLGYSFGGLVAYEIARQLYEKHGTTVRSLILIDPLTPVQDIPIIPEEINENQFWSYKTMGFLHHYLMNNHTFNHSIDHLLNSSSSEQQREEHFQKMMEDISPILKQRFQKLNINGEQSIDNHQDLMVKRIFSVIQAQTRASKYYTLHAAKHAKEDMTKINAIMFTLTQNNHNNKNEIKHQIWKTLLPNLQIKQVEGNHHTMLEAPTVNQIIDQLKSMNIL